jgi:hypothetical protein
MGVGSDYRSHVDLSPHDHGYSPFYFQISVA